MTIASGYLEFASPSHLGTGSLTLNGGGLRWASGNTASLSGRQLVVATNGAFWDTNGNDVALASAFSGTGVVRKIGAGTLSLSGNNTVAGLQIEDGQLSVPTGAILGVSGPNNLNVNSGALHLAGGTLQVHSANLTGNAVPVLAATTTSLFNTNGFSATLAGFSGEGALSKVGAGTLTLSGNNTFSGGMSVQQGTLAFAGASSRIVTTLAPTFGTNPSATLTVAAGASFTSQASVTVGDNQSDAGTLLIADTGSEFATAGSLTVGHSSAGTLTISSGGQATVALDADFGRNNQSGGPGTPDIVGSGTVTVTGAASRLTIGGNLINADRGTSVLTISAGGNLTVTGNTTLARDGASANGQLLVTGTGSNFLASGSLDLAAGTGLLRVEQGGSAQIGGDASVATQIANNSSIVVTDMNSLLEIGQNLTVGHRSAGSLIIEAGGRTVVGSSVTLGVQNGPPLQLPGGFSMPGARSTGEISVSGSSSLFEVAGNIAAGIESDGKLTLANGGTAMINGHFVLGTQTGSVGTIHLDTGGTLAIGGDDALRSGAGAAVLNFAGGNLKVINSPLTSSVPATLTNTTSVDTNGLSAILSGVLSGSGGLTKIGVGTLTLSAENTYSGNTSINIGTLRLANTSGSAFGSGTVTVNSGTTLTGDGSFTGALLLAAGGTFSPGNSPGLVTIGSGSVFNGLTLMEISGLDRGVSYDAINVGGAGSITFGGTLTVSLLNGFMPSAGSNFTLFGITASSGLFDAINLPSLTNGLQWDTTALYSNGLLSVDVSPIPEPSTYAALLGVGALAWVALRRRRRNAVSLHR